MTPSIFALTRRHAILAAMPEAECFALSALRLGVVAPDVSMMALERRQLVRLQETSEGEVWVFTRLGGEVADHLIFGKEKEQLGP